MFSLAFRGFGLLGDSAVSLMGAFAWVFPAFGLSTGDDIVTAALTATLGAVAIIAVLRMLKRAYSPSDRQETTAPGGTRGAVRRCRPVMQLMKPPSDRTRMTGLILSV